jgi:two-component system, NtrC family, sensor kinase
MRFDLRFRRLSLRARLIAGYLIILGIGGLATSGVGSWIVSSTIKTHILDEVDHNLAIARATYDGQLDRLRRTIELIVSEAQPPAAERLDAIRRATPFDFLYLTDASGRVLIGASRPARTGDRASSLGIVKAALNGGSIAGTVMLPAGALEVEDPILRAASQDCCMALVAAAPLLRTGQVTGVLYGGTVLNRSSAIVDRVSDVILKPSQGQSRPGSISIFENDVRIATNVRLPNGAQALGTRVPGEIAEAVLRRGENWKGPVRVGSDLYFGAYEPIRDPGGKPIGILGVGVSQKAYTSTRDRVILSFFAVAGIGFLLIIFVTDHLVKNITRPIGELVNATRNIAAGRLDQEVASRGGDEIALLAESFNTMLESVRHMKKDLEEWGRTLEQKVEQRTADLAAMQIRVAQSERLASLGMLAAGIAHEINNPLGGMLALAALTLEDMSEDHPDRENLQEVIRQCERCRDIVRGLLDFSRQSKGKMENVDVNELLEKTLSLVLKHSLFLNVKVDRHYDPDLPGVTADKPQLQEVFMNLLVNASQAMQEQGRIAVATGYSREDRFVEVRISDTGQGIPPEYLNRIFDPFFTTKAGGQGTGLGLSIAYGIISEHQGTISVESEVGKGSTFTIRLPAGQSYGSEFAPRPRSLV